MLNLRHERMSDSFEKFHIEGLGIDAAFHHFTGPDLGDPHDHPWNFTTIILSGGYLEEIYDPYYGKKPDNRLLLANDKVFNRATHIHRIIEIISGDCWTLVLPEAWEREPRFWKWDSLGGHSRQWNESEWKLVAPR